MADHWWRAYDNSIDHPKLLKLSDAMHRAWYTLQCVASANGGVLPPTDDIAARLRMKPAKVAEWITSLVKAGLLDNDGGSFRPHNWDTRQYKIDKTDPTAAARAKRYRDAKRDAKRDDRDAAVTAKRPDTETDTDTDTEFDAVAEDAQAKSNLAFDLAEKLLVIAGHDPKFWPPGWCGAPRRVETWLAEGWPPETIIAATTATARKKPSASINSVLFFEKAIAEEVARQAAPLPQVEIRQPETLKVVTNGRQQRGGIIQAADNLIDTLRSFDAGPDEDDEIRGRSGPDPVRLISNR